MLTRRKKVEKRISEAEDRVSRLSSYSLYEWAEQAMYVYGRCLADSGTAENDKIHANMLDEAILAAEVCRVIAKELQTRSKQ